MITVNIFWFRRDLRLSDNAGLYHALKGENPVVPVFIFDKNILDDLEDRNDRRVTFIDIALEAIQQQLAELDSSLEVYYGFPADIFRQLLQKYRIGKVFTNNDYEQYAIDRDASIKALLQDNGVGFSSFKDQVIFEKNEIVKDDGTPYTVFTPFSRRWKAALNPFFLRSYPTESYFHHFHRQALLSLPTLESMGFERNIKEYFPPITIGKDIIRQYKQQRDYPASEGTSRLGVHLRFGTISIRNLARIAMELSETFLNELIWREFYQMILWQYPHVRSGENFRREFDNVQWRNNETEFRAWCEGKTGYPLVDAGMRQLNATGFMHNRLRMITASFLTKHLLIDWRWGEGYFAKRLLDYDYAANNGGWQWAAGTGCDAAPYFRIFNPILQTEKFDKDRRYIKTWVPELDSPEYPPPVIDHAFARKRAIETYGRALRRTAD